MRYKIIKKTNPIGVTTYVPMVMKRFIFIPFWYSIYYRYYGGDVKVYSWDTEYDTLAEAELAIRKHKEWVEGKEKKEIINY